MDPNEMRMSIIWHIDELINSLNCRKSRLLKQFDECSNEYPDFPSNNEVSNKNNKRRIYRFNSVMFKEIKKNISVFGELLVTGDRKLHCENSDKIENFNSGNEEKQRIKIPHGIAYHEITNYVYVADWSGMSIHVYSKEAEYISKIDLNTDIAPCGIAVKCRSMYITDNVHHTIHKLELKKDYVTMVDKSLCEITSKLNLKDNPFKSPRGLAIGSNDLLYVADSNNNRIVIIHPQNKVEIIQDKLNELFCPVDLNISEDTLYILCWVKGRGVHIIKRESGSNSLRVIFRQFHVNAFFFSIFGETVLFSDFRSHQIVIFKLEEYKNNEKALKRFPINEKNENKNEKRHHGESYFFFPAGVAVISESKFVAVSSNMKMRLQIFQFKKFLSTPL